MLLPWGGVSFARHLITYRFDQDRIFANHIQEAGGPGCGHTAMWRGMKRKACVVAALARTSVMRPNKLDAFARKICQGPPARDGKDM
jgi:hypothetical protein